jgi:hypothetical protein
LHVWSQRLFLDPSLFEVSIPLSVDMLEALLCRVRSIDFDDDIERHLYELALRDANGSPVEGDAKAAAGAGAGAAADAKSGAGAAAAAGAVAAPQPQTITSAAAVVECFHRRALDLLGPLHPSVITAAFKLALFWSRRTAVSHGHAHHHSGPDGSSSSTAVRGFSAAESLALDALLRCEKTLGIYSHAYIQGLISVGEIHMRQAEFAAHHAAGPNAGAVDRRKKQQDAVFYFSRALSFTEKLLGHHPLIGKLVRGSTASNAVPSSHSQPSLAASSFSSVLMLLLFLR